ncbi:hypothetical protein [Vibrio vulnificus]|uniref:hypothetical protein n=1 Tax=Vibrio vulnificus TaxID=672 RepID=UPI0032422F42
MNKELLLSLGAKHQKVYIESLDREINIKEVSYRGALEIAKCPNPIDRSVFTLIYTVCDDNGKLIFTTEDIDQIVDTFTFLQIQEIAYEVTKLYPIKTFDSNETVK